MLERKLVFFNITQARGKNAFTENLKITAKLLKIITVCCYPFDKTWNGIL